MVGQREVFLGLVGTDPRDTCSGVATPRPKGFCLDLLPVSSGPDHAEEPGHGTSAELGAGLATVAF